MQTTVSLEGVYVSLPNSDLNLLKTLSKKMGWSIKRQRKSGIEKALDDVKAGRVYEAKSVEDLFEQLEYLNSRSNPLVHLRNPISYAKGEAMICLFFKRQSAYWLKKENCHPSIRHTFCQVGLTVFGSAT